MPQTTDPLLGWRNRVHQGDALELMGQLPDECVGLVVTSPPYNLLNSTGGGMRGQSSGDWTSARIEQLSRGYPEHSDDMPRDEYIVWQRLCIDQMLRLLTQDGAIFYVHRPRMQNGLEESPRDILDGYHVRQAIIWDKDGGPNHSPYAFTPGHEVIYLIVKDPSPDGYRRREGIDYSTVWRVPRDKDTSHPAPFPVEIARRCISASNAAVVLDPFVGSGSTAVAAVIEGRDYIGIDLHAGYCQSSRKRLASASPRDDSPSVDSPDDSPAYDSPSVDSPDDSPSWAIVPVLWDPIDKAVYDRIAKLQKDSKLQAIPLDQTAMADELGSSPRSVSRAIAKLKTERALTIQRQRGPSLYSVSSEIPRWPVRVGGGMGTLPSTMRSDDSPDSPADDSPADDSPRFATARVPGPGLTPSINSEKEIKEGPGPGQWRILSRGQDDSPTEDTPTDLSNPASMWRAVLGRLQLEMPREHFNTFLQPCVGHAWEDGNLVVAAASPFIVSWLVLPLHQSMADEALSASVDRPAVVVYKAMPSVAQAGRTAPVAANVSPSVEDAGEPAVCPHHPEPRWRKRSRWATTKKIEAREGDEIYYCAGDSGTCTWAGSLKLGVLVDVGEEELNPYDLPRIYNAAQNRRSNPDRGRWL